MLSPQPPMNEPAPRSFTAYTQSSGQRQRDDRLFADGTVWKAIGSANTASAAAQLLRGEMERHGLRCSELSGHCADLAAGHVLTADDGTGFMVNESEQHRDRNGSPIEVGDAVVIFRTTVSTGETGIVTGFPLDGRLTVDLGPTGYAAPYDRNSHIVWFGQVEYTASQLGRNQRA